MGIQSPFNTNSSNSHIVDKMLGNAYPIVREVYGKLGEIAYLAKNTEAIMKAGTAALNTVEAVAAVVNTLNGIEPRIDEIESNLVDLGDPTGSTLVGHKSIGAGSVLRTVASKLNDTVVAADYGASPTKTALENTTAFALLEADHPGKSIDLLGNSYPVVSLPVGCRYCNGDFVLGTTRISLRRNKLDNPLDGNCWVAFGDGTEHYWLFGFVYIAATGKMLAFVKPGYRHATSDSTPLNVIESDDRGITWKNERTIHSVAGYDISHAASSVMGAGRIGLIAYVRDLDTSTYRNDFIYSDDNGYSWSIVTNVIAGSYAFTYGDMINYPTAVGGSDSSGYAVYGYGATKQLVIKTVDNGSSWAAVEIANIPSSSFNEVSVVRVNADTKWLMFLRSGGTSGNLFVSTSVDMVVWTTPVDTGFQLGGNPVYAFVDGGRLFVYCFIRDYYSTSYGKQNQLICIEESPTEVFAASSLVNNSPRVVVDSPDRGVGYLCIRKVENDFVWGYVGMESEGSTNQSGASYILFGSTRRVPTRGLLRMDASDSGNLIRNPTFELWSRGTSFTASSETKTADCWTYNASGATGTSSRVKLDPEISVLLPFRPHYGYNLHVTSPNDYAGIFQDYAGEAELYRFSGQKVSIQIWGFGSIPDIGGVGRPRLSVIFNYGVGGSATDTNSVYPNFVVSAGNMWKGVVTIQCPKCFAIPGEPAVTIGTDPYVRIQLDSGASAVWDATLCGISVNFGDRVGNFSATDYEQEELKCAKHVQTIEAEGSNMLCAVVAQSTTQAFGVISYQEMAKIPTATLLAGAASDFELYPIGAVATSITFSNIGTRSAAIGVVTSGLTVGASYLLRSLEGTSPVILLDAQ